MEGQAGHRLGGQDSTRGAGADAGHLVGGKEPIQKQGMGFRCCGALTAALTAQFSSGWLFCPNLV